MLYGTTISLVVNVTLSETNDEAMRKQLLSFCSDNEIAFLSWTTNEALVAKTDTNPLVVLSVFPSSTHKDYKTRERVRQNHIEFVDVFLNKGRTRY